MAKFTYRMQNILDIKIKLENQAKIAYATASRQLAEEQEKLREILMRRAGYERKSKELVNGTLDIQEIRECKRAIDVMKSLQRAQMMKVHAAEKTLEMAPLGPVVFLDTAGLDDRDASLGVQRVERSLRAMRRVDVALLVLDADADHATAQCAAQTETKESLLAAMEADSTLSPALKQAVIENVLKGRFFD